MENMRSAVANSTPAADPQQYVGKFITTENLASLGKKVPEVYIGAYDPSKRRWRLCFDPLWQEQTGGELPPTWVNARWLKRHGPADLCPPGYDRSVNDELIVNYLRSASAGRAWFLRSAGSGLVQRWHAKCVADSDFNVVTDKRRRGSLQHMCEACG